MEALSSSTSIFFLLGVAVVIIILILLLTRRSSEANSPPIVVPANLSKFGLISFAFKTALERPRSIAILTLVTVTLSVTSIAVLDTYTRYIAATQNVTGELQGDLDTIKKSVKSLSYDVSVLKEKVNGDTSPDAKLLTKVDVNASSSLIHDLMAFSKKYNMSRTTLFEFHARQSTYGSFPFSKISATQEVTMPGVGREIGNAQNIPVREVKYLLPTFLNGECDVVNINVREGDMSSPPFIEMLIDRGSKSAIVCPVFTPASTDPFGFLLSEWVYPYTLSPETVKDIGKQVRFTITPQVYHFLNEAELKK